MGGLNELGCAYDGIEGIEEEIMPDEIDQSHLAKCRPPQQFMEDDLIEPNFVSDVESGRKPNLVDEDMIIPEDNKVAESKPVSEIISAQSSSYQYAMPGDTIMYAEFESPHIIIPSDDFCSTITSEGDSDGFPKDTVINVESSTLSPEKPVTHKKPLVQDDGLSGLG